MEVSETPSVGAETTVAESSPSPSEGASPVNYATTSDDQLLDGVEPAETPTEGNEDVTKVEAVAEETKPEVEAKTEEEAKEEEFEGQEPEDLKRAFKAHPELRQRYFGYEAYKQVFPSIQEAREVRAMFPTIDVAKSAQDDAVMLHTVDHMFTKEPEAFLKHAYEGDRESLINLVEAIPKFLYSADPQTFTSKLGEPLARAIVTNLRMEAKERLFANAEDVEAQDLNTAIEIIEKRLFGDRPQAQPRQPRADDNDPRIKEWRQYKEGQAKYNQERVQRFSDDVRRGFSSELTKAIDEHVSKLNPSMPPGALKIAKEQIFHAVRGDLQARAYVNQLIQSQMGSGKQDADHQAQVVSFIMGHASPIVPSKVKEIMGKWTGEILAANQTQLAKAKDTPKRVDIGSASGTPKAESEKVDYRNPKHTDDWLLGITK